MDKKDISETRLILDIIGKNEFHNITQKSSYVLRSHPTADIWRFYLVYEFGHSGHLIAYGLQDSLLDDANGSYINLYYYKTGADINKKISSKLKKGYSELLEPLNINVLVDKKDDWVWKINYLYSKVFNNSIEMDEELIKYINQISTMKFMHCEKGKLSVDNMKYMNEIYKNVTERLQ